MSDANPPIASPQVRLPSRSEALWFGFRAGCFRVRRLLRDLSDRSHRRHAPVPAQSDTPDDASGDAAIVAEAKTALWPLADAPERALVLGKIENLRIARRAFDGVELRRGETLSFWAQLGRPSRRRGFAIGRELREGCLIPTVGGGLCQLSNALYEAALCAGVEIVERHAHSQTIPGSAAERGRDATVFWNYVDLRLRAPYDLRLEVDLDADHLRVRIRGRAEPARMPQAAQDRHAMPRDAMPSAEIASEATPRGAQAAPRPPGDCATCGRTACFRNTPGVREDRGTAVLLGDAPMPEHEIFLRDLDPIERLPATPAPSLRLRSVFATLRHRWRHAPPAQRAMTRAALAAEAVASRLRPQHLEVYVDQAWLPFLWRSGALAGRRFHVLMRALPMRRIHAVLEGAAMRHPHEPTLRDFRAEDALLRAEHQALAAATSWIGAHAGALAAAGPRARLLPWRLPEPRPESCSRTPGPLRLLFPASSLVRKGVLEFAAAAKGLPVELILPAHDGGEPARWGDLPLRRVADREQALALCDAVVLPAWVEHQPRALLAAIAHGKPVIATTACGLGTLPGWTEVPAGDADALRAELRRLCEAEAAARPTAGGQKIEGSRPLTVSA